MLIIEIINSYTVLYLQKGNKYELVPISINLNTNCERARPHDLELPLIADIFRLHDLALPLIVDSVWLDDLELPLKFLTVL